MLNKVPEVTVYFWIIKLLCTTVGESFADYVNETLGFGLTNTTLLFSAALVVALVAQFRLNRYVPGIYWLAVVLIGVVGTLLTDNLTDAHSVPLWLSSTVFSILLAGVFAACAATLPVAGSGDGAPGASGWAFSSPGSTYSAPSQGIRKSKVRKSCGSETGSYTTRFSASE